MTTPEDTPVTIPVEAPTVAMATLLLDHTPPVVVSYNPRVAPIQILPVDGTMGVRAKEAYEMINANRLSNKLFFIIEF